MSRCSNVVLHQLSWSSLHTWSTSITRTYFRSFPTMLLYYVLVNIFPLMRTVTVPSTLARSYYDVLATATVRLLIHTTMSWLQLNGSGADTDNSWSCFILPGTVPDFDELFHSPRDGPRFRHFHSPRDGPRFRHLPIGSADTFAEPRARRAVPGDLAEKGAERDRPESVLSVQPAELDRPVSDAKEATLRGGPGQDLQGMVGALRQNSTDIDSNDSNPYRR